LTLLYGALFLASGVALLTITYKLVEHSGATGTESFFAVRGVGEGGEVSFSSGGAAVKQKKIGLAIPAEVPPQVAKVLRTRAGQSAVQITAAKQRGSDLHDLLVESGIALAIMTLISMLLGWLVAGRVLRPLRTITASTREISEANLHRRLAMDGPRDELHVLADTIDGLLGRLDGAFDAQRRFVANASHELRTPLTSARALLEMVLSDPRATVATYRETCAQVLEESAHQEQLIDALLALAQGQRGIDRPASIELAAVLDAVLRTARLEASARGIELHTEAGPAPISGDRRLVERLVSNLLDNALRHNIPGGRVDVRLEGGAARPTLTVANTGPVVPAGETARLLQPFQRLAADRVARGDGVGLGLSIVAAIADAHGAALTLTPSPEGGLSVSVAFPPGREPGERAAGGSSSEPGGTSVPRLPPAVPVGLAHPEA
jgi:signal transduction histidine kinase